jgi:acetylornithine deacetylase/succinyl-diaminopimelate desuccinylase-like protein
VSGPADALLGELGEFLRIPSISAEAGHADDVRRAAEWVCELIRRFGGACELVDWHGRPLAIGELRASGGADRAPTVLVYGHFDVQPPEPLDLWETPPFEPTARDGWLYARGVADDKGQLYVLLRAAGDLAARGELPVNIRIACDGEEEIGGHSIVDFLADDERGADVAVIFDTPMVRRGMPSLTVGTRGLVYWHLRVRAAARDLHSGLYGGAALNAAHGLVQALGAVLPRDGRLPESLRAGITPATDDELRSWSALPTGDEELSTQGARLADPRAAEEFYTRTWAEPSLDVNGVGGGAPSVVKTVVPAVAEANVSIRLAPGQDPDVVAAAFERLVQEAAPANADLELERVSSVPPGLVPPDHPALGHALGAFESVFGVRPLLVRSGGTLPIVPALAARNIPTVLSGLAVPESNIHAPNERLPLEYLDKGLAVAAALYRALATLG